MKKNLFVLIKTFAIFVFHFCLINATFAQPVIHVAALAFGTVHWELEVMKRQELDHKNGFDLQIVTIANKDASHILLMGNSVDMTVTDWLWVMRQRADKQLFLQLPYSKLTGDIMVQNDPHYKSVADLAGKKLGVAGGPLDKSWLLVQAYMRELKLKNPPELIFAAPPLLNELMKQNKLDADLNYWNYDDILLASGKKILLPVSDLFTHFGLSATPPITGWTYREEWGKKNPELINGFAKADLAAKKLLESDDAIWDKIRPIMAVQDDAEFKLLRDTYRKGIVHCLSEQDLDNAKKLFELLHKIGGAELLGENTKFTVEIFVSPNHLYDCPK